MHLYIDTTQLCWLKVIYISLDSNVNIVWYCDVDIRLNVLTQLLYSWFGIFILFDVI